NELYSIWCDRPYKTSNEEKEALKEIKKQINVEDDNILNPILNYASILQQIAFEEGFKIGFKLSEEIHKSK
ncbi:MAG: hypothetical protein LUH02_07310, partial [Erysipelotrichaceae bacterium]|nr:hypothetical protein [Erysipelotrichaceae bacterium]